MATFWHLPLALFMIGAAAQAATLLVAYSRVSLPDDWLRVLWAVLSLTWWAGDTIVHALPITHSCFGYNLLEARILDITMVFTGGLQCAAVGIVIQTGAVLARRAGKPLCGGGTEKFDRADIR